MVRMWMSMRRERRSERGGKSFFGFTLLYFTLILDGLDGYFRVLETFGLRKGDMYDGYEVTILVWSRVCMFHAFLSKAPAAGTWLMLMHHVLRLDRGTANINVSWCFGNPGCRVGTPQSPSSSGP